MSQLGFGVMIKALFGDRGAVDPMKYVGKELAAISHDDDNLHLTFTDGTKLTFSDEGQSCCEHRYMTTDDDLPYYVGAKLVDVEIADGPEAEGDYGDVHEQQFLNVYTDRGKFQMVNHNVHNGYYGGFWITVHEG